FSFSTRWIGAVQSSHRQGILAAAQASPVSSRRRPDEPNGVSPMFRYLTALFATLLVVLPVSAQGKQLSIRSHGQAFFEIKTSAGTRIVIDPHAIEAFGERKNIKADLICISHLHNDHTQVEVIENFDPRNADKMVRLGLTPPKTGDRNKGEWNIIDEK